MKKLLAYLLVHRSRKKDTDLATLEQRQTPDGSPFFNDSFYFCGRGDDGTSLVFRLGYRPGQETELWCDLLLPGLGRFRALDPGLRFECKEPAKTWTISYAGPMETQGRTATVSVSLVFTADSPIVDFGANGDAWGLATALAAQKWSRSWLEKLRDLRQVHYEQCGRVSGRVEVDGRVREVSLPAVRDHSFGARDWNAMRRHAWLMALLEDGSHVNVSVVGYEFLPYMHSGYRMRNGVIEPVTLAPRFEDLPAGNPKGITFDVGFRAGRSERLTLSCTVDEVLEYTMSGAYTFFEGCAKFRMGNVKGVGICELGIHHSAQ